MRTSLNEIKVLEQHLLQEAPPEDSLLFEAHMILAPELKEKVQWQQKTYQLVRAYGCKKLKAEIEAVHHQLFTETKYRGFRQKILDLFLK
jgi:hypothetical protein